MLYLQNKALSTQQSGLKHRSDNRPSTQDIRQAFSYLLHNRASNLIQGRGKLHFFLIFCWGELGIAPPAGSPVLMPLTVSPWYHSDWQTTDLWDPVHFDRPWQLFPRTVLCQASPIGHCQPGAARRWNPSSKTAAGCRGLWGAHPPNAAMDNSSWSTGSNI